MRKTLLAIAFAGAALAPATAVTVAATLAPTAAIAAPQKILVPHDKHKVVRCLSLQRISLVREKLKLHFRGYSRIWYKGSRSNARRCTRYLSFFACKGARGYRVTVRFVRFSRDVSARPTRALSRRCSGSTRARLRAS